MSRVFVVVPAYNAESFIGDCLDSLVAQTVPWWRAAVIDDGSADGTFRVAQGYAARDERIEAHEFPNGGVAVARNRGMSMAPADTEFVLFLDNDDFLYPDALQTLVARLDADVHAVAAYGLPRVVDASGRATDDGIAGAYGAVRREVVGRRARLVPAGAPTTFAGFVRWCDIASPGQVLIRASSLRAVGPFDPDTVPSDDWDMWLRLSMRGDFAFLPRFTLNKRSHAENVSSKGKVMAVAEPVIRNKLATSPELSAEQRKVARAGQWQSVVFRLAWIRADLNRRHLRRAAKGVYRVAESYVRYLRTWVRPPRSRTPANERPAGQ